MVSFATGIKACGLLRDAGRAQQAERVLNAMHRKAGRMGHAGPLSVVVARLNEITEQYNASINRPLPPLGNGPSLKSLAIIGSVCAATAVTALALSPRQRPEKWSDRIDKEASRPQAAQR